METFARLLDTLIYTRSRNAKIAAIATYLRETPDPDRGWALAALTDATDFPAVKAATIRNLAMERVDPELFRLSRDFVGDTAETVALVWPEPDHRAPLDWSLGTVAEALLNANRRDAPALLARLFDALDADARYALIKLATGALRVGVSARLAKTAVADAFGLDLDAVEEIWHALEPPYQPLFAWAEGGPRPDPEGTPYFRPFMLAHPLEDEAIDLADFAAEWKWDGIRVQIARVGGQQRLYSRGGEDITAAFPDIAAAQAPEGVFDGELMVRGDAQMGEAASFNALQQRLGRKQVSARMLEALPAFVRLYDVLVEGTEDLRAFGWQYRRARLETLMPGFCQHRFDLSALIDAPDLAALEALRANARESAIEGVMLKRRNAPYVAGRKVGLWYKWKREPLTADCVMMYAQRGSGKRSSFYSDFTFGCWTEDGELVPVGKAYSGFSDSELKWLDRFVRQNTINRFGPVREVEKTLVLEIAFESIHASKRHKSGLAMRFPRIARLRRDKPAAEADRVATLLKLVS